MNKDYVVREYREGDEEGIFELWRMIHPDDRIGRDEWMRYWTWLYRDNPAGEGLIYIAEDNGKIICHHAIIPIWLKIGKELVLGSWGVDAMTHPQYRRQGIWEKVIKKIWVRAAEKGIDITPGFPNRYSLPGLTGKLQWFEVATTTLALKPVDLKKTISLKASNRFVLGTLLLFVSIISGILKINRRRLPEIEGISFKNITSFDERFTGLWNKIADQYLIMTVRTPDYLNWRFSRPDAEYRIVAAEQNDETAGYIVFREQNINGTPVLYIVDLAAESPEIMQCLVAEGVKTCKRDDIAALIFSYIADDKYRIPLTREGFLYFPFLKGGLFCARLNTDRFPQSLLQDYRNWLVQPSDADTI
jgi:GNAT superfamily N-acetyltransferase